MNNTIKMISGSIFVYLVVAACSAYSGNGKDVDGRGMAGSNSVGNKPIKNGEAGSQNPIMNPTINPIMSPVLEAEAAEDGGRIVNRYLVTEDGLKTSVGFFDKLLNKECHWSYTSDGKYRCVTILKPLSIDYGMEWFSNESCSDRIVRSGSNCQEFFARESIENQNSCNAISLYKYYELNSEPYYGDVYHKMIGDDVTCILSHSVNETDTHYAKYYTVVQEINPDRWVEGNIVTN